jgi:hypothetical protein
MARSPSREGVVYLEAAVLLGRRIAGKAIWHENRCTWVGASLDEGRGLETALNYTTLGPDLYEGTSGVALFLAELAAITGDELFRRTAKGAIAHALARAPELAVKLDRSLYLGRLGIAVAAARVGAAVGETQYLEAAAQLPAGNTRPMARGEFDIISGRAGSVYGLLWLSAKLAMPRFGEEALRLAWELAEAAERSGVSGSEVSWAAVPGTAAGNLQGSRMAPPARLVLSSKLRKPPGRRNSQGSPSKRSRTNAPSSMLECGTGPIYELVPERLWGVPGRGPFLLRGATEPPGSPWHDSERTSLLDFQC